jgi:aminoglycoside phosphotransferase
MPGVCHDQVARVKDDELRQFVRSALVARRNSPPCEVIRTPYDYYSSFAIELLVANLQDGTQLPLIFKDLSPNALLEEARRVRPSELYQPEREIIVYRNVLAAAGLGTPTCYGSLIDQKADRYWLLLEKVAGDELYTIGEFSIWLDVARWLACAHSQLAESLNVQQTGTLLRYDARFFHTVVERAIAHSNTRRQSVDVNPGSLRSLWTMCHEIVDRIVELPRTIIHGDFYASNILVAAQDTNHRICPVDWELAGVGPGLMDLAALVSGKWSELERQKLARAYFDALSCPQALNDFEEFATAFLACRLLLAVAWLGWSPDWKPPEMHRHNWLAEALSISEQLQELG